MTDAPPKLPVVRKRARAEKSPLPPELTPEQCPEIAPWITLDKASKMLGMTRQGVGGLAMRLGWGRACIGHVVLISRSAVEQYRRSRQLSGPRKPRPSAAE